MKSPATIVYCGLVIVAGAALGAGSMAFVFWLIPIDSGNSREATIDDAEWLGGLSHANGVRRRYNPYDDAELKSAWDRGWDDQP